MKCVEYIRYDEEFAKNISGKLLAKLITLDEVIPDGINNVLWQNNPVYDKERNHFVEDRWDIIEQMQAMRFESEKLYRTPFKMTAFDNNLDFKFVLDHPELKPLIHHIEFCDENLEIIEEVPFDEYLEKYYQK